MELAIIFVPGMATIIIHGLLLTDMVYITAPTLAGDFQSVLELDGDTIPTVVAIGVRVDIMPDTDTDIIMDTGMVTTEDTPKEQELVMQPDLGIRIRMYIKTGAQV